MNLKMQSIIQITLFAFLLQLSPISYLIKLSKKQVE